MSFTSIYFLPFMVAVYLVFLISKNSYRWAILLLASIIFYLGLALPYLLIILICVVLINYFWALWIDASQSPQKRKVLLISGIFINILIFFGTRYAGLLSQALHFTFAALQWVPVAIIPGLVTIGVSFYIFQALAYLINIYLEIDSPEKHLGYFALYMSFFPKLLQGPIERPGSLLTQLHQPFIFNAEQARSGLYLFAWGLFKKVMIADRLAIIVNFYYNDVIHHQGLGLIFATYLFAFQIYFDFSGYSDMAIGIARLFNIELTQNFKQPYLAITVTEFWRRWHISFSSWLQDYVFRPLQLSLRHWKTKGAIVALLITFLVSGIWHGASWNFVVWGLLFGIFMALEILSTPIRKKINRKYPPEKSWWVRAWQIGITFNLVSFAWIFFRANNFSDAVYIIGHLFSGIRLVECAKLTVKTWILTPVLTGTLPLSAFGAQAPQVCLATLQDFPLFPGKFSTENLAILLISVFIYLISGYIKPISSWPSGLRWAGYLCFSLWLLFGIWMIETLGQPFQEFLYFRF